MSNSSEVRGSDRRGFLRKLFGLTASAGIAGLLVDRLLNRYSIPPVQASGPGTQLTVDGNAGTGVGTTQLSSSGNPAFQSTNTSNGAALQGTCTAGTGVLGTTTTGTGVQGVASGSGGTALSGFAGDPGAIPIVATGASGQSANLQEWHSGTAVSVVDKNGNFGIGTSSPKAQLHVSGSATADVFCGLGPHPEYLGHGPAMNYGYSGHSLGEGSGFFNVRPDPAAVAPNPSLRFMTVDIQRMIITNTGKVGIGTTNPTHLIQLSGGAYSDGATWNPSSSVRWKENIEPLTDGVDMLKQLHPVAYNYKKTPEKRTMGFIAEEVGKVLPSVVDWDKAEPGYAEGYDHLAILALSVQALKEQQTRIEQLATRNSERQTEIEAMKDETEKLQERIAILERTVKQFAAR